MTQVAFGTLTDDAGDYQSGTILDAAFFTNIKTNLDAVVHSSANPTITPEDIIDEVVTARGSLGTLDARLDVEHNNDGTHNLPATIATTTILRAAIGVQNLVADSAFMIWGAGAALAPSHYTLSGTGAAVARVTSPRKVGAAAAQVTYGSDTAKLQQTLVPSGEWASWDNLEGEEVGLGCWVYSSTVSQVRIYVDDGSGTITYSAYHTGGGTWEWLTLTAVHTISATATSLAVGCQIAGTGNFVMSGLTATIGGQNPDRWLPSPCVYGAIIWKLPGTPTVADGKEYFVFARPSIVRDIQLYFDNDPTGGVFTYDIEKGDGTTWASIFAAAKSVADGKEFGNHQPDHATYANRCFAGVSAADGADGDAAVINSVIRLNVDVVNAAADVTVMVRIMQFARPLEQALAYNTQG